MSSSTPRAQLPLLAAAQAQKHVTHNDALLQLDALLFARFLSRNVSTPPATPSDGDTYLVKPTASGAWTGQNGQIAYANGGVWRFAAPFTGLTAYVVDETKLIVFNGSAWVDYGSLIALQNIPMLGVDTTADTTNRLAVQSNAALFTALPTSAGGTGDLRIVNNKASVGNTASFLFQDTFSGRAEIGLCGDDNFHFKVAVDGATWKEALNINAASGLATLAGDPTQPLGIASKQYVDGKSVTIAGHVVPLGGTQALASTDLSDGASLATLNGTQTLSNKTLSGSANTLSNIANAALTNSSLTIAGHVVPLGGTQALASTDLSDGASLATLSGTQTLTNKTLSGASNTFSNIANTALSNSSLTIAGHTVALGGTQAVAASDLSNGVNGTGAVVLSSLLGAANGIATLDGTGKLSAAQLNATVATLSGTQTLTNKLNQAQSGSAAAPGYAFAANVNTGLFNPSPNVVAFAINGTEMARLLSVNANTTANLLIGASALVQSNVATFIHCPGANLQFGLGIDAASTNGSTRAIEFTVAGSVCGAVSYASSTSVAYNTTSDARLKDVLPEQADYRDAIKALWVGDFAWKETGEKSFGVLAQQAHTVMPHGIGVTEPENEADHWHASSEPFAHLALWGVKDLYALVEAQAHKIAELEAQLAKSEGEQTA